MVGGEKTVSRNLEAMAWRSETANYFLNFYGIVGY
ncbi:hypothetical protein FHS10_005091 [Mucilaginibacter dorajii]|nr:hypothetical protein [Mucilaginibacter dorajii]